MWVCLSAFLSCPCDTSYSLFHSFLCKATVAGNSPVIRAVHGRDSLIARFMWSKWGPSGADRTQVGPMLAPWTLLSGQCPMPIKMARIPTIRLTTHYSLLRMHWTWSYRPIYIKTSYSLNQWHQPCLIPHSQYQGLFTHYMTSSTTGPWL